MEAIKTVISSLCVAMVFFGVVMMLIPEGTMQKSFKTFVSTAIIAVMVIAASGVSSALSDFEFDISQNTSSKQADALSDTVDSINCQAVEVSVKDLITQKLEAKGLENFEIFVSANISEDKSISITEVEIVCKIGDGQTCSEVLKELGLDGKVTEREE